MSNNFFQYNSQNLGGWFGNGIGSPFNTYTDPMEGHPEVKFKTNLKPKTPKPDLHHINPTGLSYDAYCGYVNDQKNNTNSQYTRG